jgi:SUMO ligase MMS21 Smc5/6 complex component
MFLTAILLLTIQLTFGQKIKSYINEEVKDAQLTNVQSIMTALENGEVESAAKYFDNSIHDLKSNLKSISTEISKLKTETKFSIVIILDQGFNIYRCRYNNDNGEIYQIDLFMSEVEPDSEVKKLKTKNANVLKTERKKRRKNNAPPPPPN